MKHFELSPFGANKLIHLLSDLWMYQKYPPTLSSKIATLTGEGGEKGGGLCVYMCVEYSKLPYYCGGGFFYFVISN